MATSHVRTADERRVGELRAQLPALARYTYLNTGTAGPLPRAVSDVMAAEAARELTEGRTRPGFLEQYQAVHSRARALMAAALGVSVDEVALAARDTRVFRGEAVRALLHHNRRGGTLVEVPAQALQAHA